MRSFLITATAIVIFFMAPLFLFDRSGNSYAFQQETHSANGVPLLNEEEPGDITDVGSESTFTDPIIGMELVTVQSGCFLMGDSFGDGEQDERPLHDVCVDSFAMAKYTITVGQFRTFVNATSYRTDAEKGGGCFTADADGRWSWQFLSNWRNPGFSQIDNHPVVCVSWNDANEFSKWLSLQSGRNYRLPTEAEWEYAARGGTEGRNYWGNSIDEACMYANVRDLTANRTFPGVMIHNCDDGYAYTAPVGSYKSNILGLYDMMGNVWQWTADWYGKTYYRDSPKKNPAGPSSGDRRVPRGGSWRSNSEHLRASLRIHPPPSQTAGVGFRLVSPAQSGHTAHGISQSQPRFKDNDDKTVTDQLTGLVWPMDANPAGGYNNWQQALEYIKIINSGKYLGHNDWRLPNINELASMVNRQGNLVTQLEFQGLNNVQADYYWTSTTYASHTSYAWAVGMHGGIVAGRGKMDFSYIWPVRNGQLGYLSLAQTGQKNCYDNSGITITCTGTGQDGELQTGTVWPRPRFKDNGDQTITDSLTGLVWSKNGKTPGPTDCSPGSNKTQQGAPDYIQCLNSNKFLEKNDWRLPNRNELASLVHRGQPDSAAYLNAQGFADVDAYGYWSSTSYTSAAWNAWIINMHDGAVTPIAKKIKANIWPVRGGQ